MLEGKKLGYLGLVRGGGHWNLCFSRNLNDWELNNIEQFFAR